MINFKVEGIDGVDNLFDEITPRNAQRLIRATIGGVASEARTAMRKAAPRDQGDLRKGIKVRRPRTSPNAPRAEVVTPVFYWRFFEDGTRKMAARPFVGPTAHKIEADLPTIVDRQFGKKLEAAIKRAQKKMGQG